MRPSFSMSGSILGGTAEHRLLAIETDLEIEASESADAIRSVVDQAERMCFVLDSIEQPHRVERRSFLNGSAL